PRLLSRPPAPPAVSAPARGRRVGERLQGDQRGLGPGGARGLPRPPHLDRGREGEGRLLRAPPGPAPGPRPAPPHHRGGWAAPAGGARRPGDHSRLRESGGGGGPGRGRGPRGGYRLFLPGLRLLRPVPRLRGPGRGLRPRRGGPRMKDALHLQGRALPPPTYDRLLLWSVLGLTTLGLVMVYSA